MTPHFSLAGKTAIVTGGRQGIGAACVSRLRDAGAQVIIADLQTVDADPLSFACDVSNEDQIKALVDFAVTKTGRLDIVVNNAGIHTDYARLDAASVDNLARETAVNTASVMLTLKHAGAAMADGGAFVNIASAAAVLGVQEMATYAASKAGVIALTKVGAIELAPRAIRVNAICPGSVRTPMAMEDGGEDLLAVEALATPLGRICEPEEVAALVQTMVAPDCAYMTGQAINLCGGLTAGISQTTWEKLAS
jgi:NAD(P)-dependent dehydrogenase (short-subunit alcohol dehydrogenase family)